MAKKQKELVQVRALEKILKVRFKNSKKLASAVIHTSFTHHGEKSHYERFEFFGDAILNFVICEKLFSEFPDANEGTLSRLRSTLVSRKILSRIAKKLLLNRFVMISENERKEKRHQNAKLLADTLEAVIGAVYLDRGFKIVCEFILRNWDGYFDEKRLRNLDPNPKSTLQEMVQKIFRILPHYQTKPHRDGFSATVSAKKGLSAKGTGTSKQEAEAEAAQNLIRKIKARKSYSRFWKSDSKSVISVSESLLLKNI